MLRGAGVAGEVLDVNPIPSSKTFLPLPDPPILITRILILCGYTCVTPLLKPVRAYVTTPHLSL